MIYVVLFIAYVVYVVPQHLRLDAMSLMILTPWIMAATHVMHHGSLGAIGVLVGLPVLTGVLRNERNDSDC